MQPEVGNRKREIVDADTEVLPVGMTIVHSRFTGEDRLCLMVSIKDLVIVVKTSILKENIYILYV